MELLWAAKIAATAGHIVPLVGVHDAHLMLALAEGFGESPIAALLAPDIDPAALLAAPTRAPELAPDLPPRVAERLCRVDLGARAAAIRAQAENLGMRVLTPLDVDWPARLSQQPLRPLVLFTRGDVRVLQQAPAVAIVGSRSPTPYGIDAAEDLAGCLARSGTVLWSGLARGIDAIAHRACLAHGVPTVAVLAGALDRIYPPEHEALANRIVDSGGCLCTELPPTRRARRGHFVRRNRLLAAGPTAVVVVEGSLSSGALHTARFAADCDTEVLAVPGPWRSERSQGCHRLIAEGAGIVESTQSLLQVLGLNAALPGSDSLQLAGSADEQAILEQLARGPRPTDLLRRESALDEVAFLRALFRLEQRGALLRLPGDLWRAIRR